jgi:ribosomal protein S18 acetylase RimI-like enzyme
MQSFAWRVEAVCHKAWPALREVRLGDWMLRTAPGISRRSNSLNPMSGRATDIDAALAAAAPLFAEEGLPTLVRVLTLLDPAVDARLAALGFTGEGETTALYGDLPTSPTGGDDIIRLSRPDDAWFGGMHALQTHSETQAVAYRRVVQAIAVPAAFLRLTVDGEDAALAFGVMHDRLLCCESVIIAPPFRGRGYARRMMQALCAWATAEGAEGVCLQVVSDNDPALALYRGLGLTTELYRYHYRRAAD